MGWAIQAQLTSNFSLYKRLRKRVRHVARIPNWAAHHLVRWAVHDNIPSGISHNPFSHPWPSMTGMRLFLLCICLMMRVMKLADAYLPKKRNTMLQHIKLTFCIKPFTTDEASTSSLPFSNSSSFDFTKANYHKLSMLRCRK